MVETHWQIIEAVAEALFLVEEMAGERIKAIVEAVEKNACIS